MVMRASESPNVQSKVVLPLIRTGWVVLGITESF